MRRTLCFHRVEVCHSCIKLWLHKVCGRAVQGGPQRSPAGKGTESFAPCWECNCHVMYRRRAAEHVWGAPCSARPSVSSGAPVLTRPGRSRHLPRGVGEAVGRDYWQPCNVLRDCVSIVATVSRLVPRWRAASSLPRRVGCDAHLPCTAIRGLDGVQAGLKFVIGSDRDSGASDRPDVYCSLTTGTAPAQRALSTSCWHGYSESS